jgi:hypothetical protein
VVVGLAQVGLLAVLVGVVVLVVIARTLLVVLVVEPLRNQLLLQHLERLTQLQLVVAVLGQIALLRKVLTGLTLYFQLLPLMVVGAVVVQPQGPLYQVVLAAVRMEIQETLVRQERLTKALLVEILMVLAVLLEVAVLVA